MYYKLTKLQIQISKYQTRKNRRGGELFIFLLESLSYKFRDNLPVNFSAIECLCVEVFNKNSKSIVLSLAYRIKELVLVGDFNINIFDFNERKMVQNSVNLIFPHDLIPTINKPTQVTRNTATAHDHIITSSVKMLNSKQILSRLTYHFSIFFIFKCVIDSTEAKEEFIYKCNYSSNSIETFKHKLREVNWNEVKQSHNANQSFAKFYEICTSLYEERFPKFKIKLNEREKLSPWITKGIKNSSKRKQKLYEKFLKKRKKLTLGN